MKSFKTLLAVGVVIALAMGCSTTSEKENMLSAAGFKAVQANTPEREAHLKSLPKDKITAVRRNGVVYYTFPDPKSNTLYVGTEQQYQQYQKLRYQKQMADEQLNTAEMYNEAPWGVWGWGGGGWAWR
jgi:hypothetical protein